MPHAVAELFRQAAELNRKNPQRKGNVVHLDDTCGITLSGDLHGNRPGLNKIIRYANLDQDASSRLILQELVHGPPDAAGQDRSIDLLLRAVRLMISHPQQVIFLMGNHDLAQAVGNEITKEGRGVVKEFSAGIRATYGADAQEVLDSIGEYFLSMPLAARSANGVWMSHSLPAPSRMSLAGLEILQRPYVPEDYRRGGGVYEWTWGRGHTSEQLEALAGQLQVGYFILGHRHSQQGCVPISPRGMTVASDHEHGCVVQFNADAPLTGESVMQHVKYLAEI